MRLRHLAKEHTSLRFTPQILLRLISYSASGSQHFIDVKFQNFAKLANHSLRRDSSVVFNVVHIRG